VETKFESRERRGGGTITFWVDGEQVGQGRFEDSVPVIFTASETFDIGMDLGSPVSLDYYERAPFKFNGLIEKINIKYI
jgi:arylsulfatase